MSHFYTLWKRQKTKCDIGLKWVNKQVEGGGGGVKPPLFACKVLVNTHSMLNLLTFYHVFFPKTLDL